VPLVLADILAQPINKGGVNATSAVTSLGSATTAGNTLLIAATTYGSTGISTPSGYTRDTPLPSTTQKVYLFRKSNIAAGETLPTLATGASTQKTSWFALELAGLDLVSPLDVASAIATATAQSISTGTALGTGYDTIGLALFLAQDASSTTAPSWSGYIGNWTEQAEQGASDATTSTGAALAVYDTLLSLSLPTASATSSLGANGPLAAVAVKYLAAGSKQAADLRHFSGFEHGTVAGIATGTSGSRLFETVSGSPIITSSTPRHGNFCLELPDTAAAHNLTWPAVVIAGTGTRIPARLCFRFVGNLPTADTELASFDTGTTEVVVVRYVAASQKIGVQVTNSGNDGAQQISAATVQADTWHAVDLEYDPNTSPNSVNWQLDGVDQTQAVGAVDAASTGITMRIGRRAATAPGCAIRLDDCLIAGRRGNYPLGDYKILLLPPSGTITVVGGGGSSVMNTFSANGTMAAWDAATALSAISEGPPPIIGASAAGIAQVTADTVAYVRIPMGTYTTAAEELLHAAQMLVCGWAASATANTLGFRARLSGGAETITLQSPILDPGFDNSITDPAWLVKTINPTGGWDQAKLDSLELEMGGSDDATPDPGMHWIGCSVAISLPLYARQENDSVQSGSEVAVSRHSEGQSSAELLNLKIQSHQAKGWTVTRTGPTTAHAWKTYTEGSIGRKDRYFEVK
jgi:hypothetical protein